MREDGYSKMVPVEGFAMDEIKVLESVLAKDQGLIEGIDPQRLSAPTPCPDYDVNTLVNHMVGWLQVFDAAANHRTFETATLGRLSATVLSGTSKAPPPGSSPAGARAWWIGQSA